MEADITLTTHKIKTSICVIFIYNWNEIKTKEILLFNQSIYKQKFN